MFHLCKGCCLQCVRCSYVCFTFRHFLLPFRNAGGFEVSVARASKSKGEGVGGVEGPYISHRARCGKTAPPPF